MTYSIGEVRDDIMARGKLVVPRAWIAEVPEKTATPKNPYAIYYFVPPVRSARDRRLTGTRGDTLVSGFTVRVFSDTAEDALSAIDSLYDIFAGYKPFNCGELSLESGAPYSVGSTIVSPQLYVESLFFSFRTNLITER